MASIPAVVCGHQLRRAVAFGAFVFAHDAMYRLHRRWFDLSVTRFDELAYGLFGLYKLAIWFFLLIPGLVLMALT